MPRVPATAATPQDRKPKADKFDPSAPFVFEAGGDTYEISNVIDHMTGGWVRNNVSGGDGLTATYALVSASCDAETLAVVDGMGLREHAEFLGKFDAYVEAVMGATMGEFGGSSS